MLSVHDEEYDLSPKSAVRDRRVRLTVMPPVTAASTGGSTNSTAQHPSGTEVREQVMVC